MLWPMLGTVTEQINDQQNMGLCLKNWKNYLKIFRTENILNSITFLIV